MLNFEDELRRYQPIPEIEQTEESIRHHNLDDMADVALGVILEAREEAARMAGQAPPGVYAPGVPVQIEVPDALL